ncbi:hypothetical protein GGI03_008646 [Coemansia sp. RSA 2337]|nr:hypothetical protein H4S03_008331 [Coemansia sp. S3946]KAJ2043147.1 hypothetical protein GGH13_009825 [Coemansia sp. S155-1]KAJ2340610.1 hypothetical protein GGH92_006186 [Coemansia sp. RSA 2673]KAJ2440165.1 hypothetical protein GGI03_008646 [Coemansia sp. RSA 2337]
MSLLAQSTPCSLPVPRPRPQQGQLRPRPQSMIELQSLSLPRPQPCTPTSRGTKRRRLEEENEPDCSLASPRKRSPSLGIKQQEQQEQEQELLQKRRRSSTLRLSLTKPPPSPLLRISSLPASPSSASKKLKTRSALQAIHVRALEHGLRVPICNTPLGVVSLAENIISPTRPVSLVRPLVSLPAMPVSPRTGSRTPLSAVASVSVPSSPALRPSRISRRNTISCDRPVPLLEI